MRHDEALPPITDKQAESLIKLYQKAEDDIQRLMLRALERGNDLTYLSRIRTNVYWILKDLRKKSRKWTSTKLMPMYKLGSEFALAEFAQLPEDFKWPKGEILTGFGGIHQQAVLLLAQSADSRLDDVIQTIGRRVDDIYRSLALEATRGSVVGYQTWRQVARQYRQSLLDQGITGFVDKRGRAWNMTTYTEMVARQTTAEAHWQGTENRLIENGFDLVIFSSHVEPCGLCRPWEGKVVSLTGQTPGYPTMREAMTWKGGKGVRHVRCRHAFGLYVRELMEGA